MSTDKIIQFKTPFPPSTNSIWQYAKGRVYLSKTVVSFKEQVYWSIKKQKMDKAFDGPLKLMVVLHPKDNIKRDVDNFGTKALLDALTYAGVWKDDQCVKDLHTVWGKKSKKPYVDVAIKPISGNYTKTIDELLALENLALEKS